MRRFGAEGLKLSFKPVSSAEPAAGANHGIDVLLTDSIRDFKEKVTVACANESRPSLYIILY